MNEHIHRKINESYLFECKSWTNVIISNKCFTDRSNKYDLHTIATKLSLFPKFLKPNQALIYLR